MPPAGGKRISLTQPGGAPIASYNWGSWSHRQGGPGPGSSEPQLRGGGDAATQANITEFRDVFQPGRGIFSPSYPLVPPEHEQVRVWDFPAGYNTIYTPRSYEPVGFDELRGLAESHDITRL